MDVEERVGGGEGGRGEGVEVEGLEGGGGVGDGEGGGVEWGRGEHKSEMAEIMFYFLILWLLHRVFV